MPAIESPPPIRLEAISIELAPIPPPTAPSKAAFPTSPPVAEAIKAFIPAPITAEPTVEAPTAPAPKRDSPIAREAPPVNGATAANATAAGILQPPGILSFTTSSK